MFATILGLFLFGSFKYQIHKNALTYGMLMIIAATFYGLPTSEWHAQMAESGLGGWIREHLLSFHGWDDLVHADTMLFILGLTLFVSVIAQTRLLEGITFFLLRRYQGAILPTVISVTAVVAFASGILDGVSMIGLTIRTLVIVMMLAAEPLASVRYAVMVCTAVTTICGIWLAYGEPPNLIMKANLYPYLDNPFFLRYCAPAAIASYLLIAWQLRRRSDAAAWTSTPWTSLTPMPRTSASCRPCVTAKCSVRSSWSRAAKQNSDEHTEPVLARLRNGEPLGLALVRENVPETTRKRLLGHFVAEDLADSLDRHYVLDAAGDHHGALLAEQSVDEVLATMARLRSRAQLIGAFALVPFIGLLILHGINHNVPLFLASFAAFFAALPGIARLPKMRALALHEARHEYAEYYFLFPLFFSITLLTRAGFFDELQGLIVRGIDMLGHSHVAFAQFLGSTFLSAILDNNVVADFASRGLHGLDISVLHLFAMAQIAGYALGGCWTHIGCAQSVVAFAFIKRDVDEHYTPVQWIKEMTPVILSTLFVITAIIYAEGALLSWMG